MMTGRNKDLLGLNAEGKKRTRADEGEKGVVREGYRDKSPFKGNRKGQRGTSSIVPTVNRKNRFDHGQGGTRIIFKGRGQKEGGRRKLREKQSMVPEKERLFH